MACGVERLAGELSAGAVGAEHDASRVADAGEAEQSAERYESGGNADPDVERVDGGRVDGVRDLGTSMPGIAAGERLCACLRGGDLGGW